VVTGVLVGTVRTLPNSPWLVRAGNAWVELFRNIPILVQIFLWTLGALIYFIAIRPKLTSPSRSRPRSGRSG